MTIRDAVLSMTPWLRHHSTCARVEEAGSCDCGLNDKLLALRVLEPERPKHYPPLERPKGWL